MEVKCLKCGRTSGLQNRKGGTIRIPYGKVDAALIEKIAKWRWQTMPLRTPSLYPRMVSTSIFTSEEFS